MITDHSPAAPAAERSATLTARQLVRALASAGARTLLGTVLLLGLWGAAPALLGWHSTTVMTGSMEPRIAIGDVAVAKPVQQSDLGLGQVLLFADPDHQGRLRLHRLVDIDAQGLLVTKGDANPDLDSTHVAAGSVVGRATLRVPYVGLPVVWLRDGELAKVGLVVTALTALLVLASADGDLRNRPTRGVAAGATTGVRRPGRNRLLAGAGLALATLVLTPIVFGSTGSFAAFAGATNTKSTMAAATYYRCSAAVSADSPYLFYKLDETSPTDTSQADDSSGAARHGIYQGGATSTTKACSGDTGSAVTLNGSSQSVVSGNVPAVAGPNTFTLEAWFKTSTKQGKIIGFGNSRTAQSGSYDRHLYINTAGQVVFGVYPGTVKTITSSAVVTDGSWHHVAATLSSAGMVLYLDGVQVASDTSVTTGEGFNGFWRVGYDSVSGWTSAPSSGYFNGSLDNVAVYTTALTATQIAGHYNAR